MFIPALVALAAWVLARRDPVLPSDVPARGMSRRIAAVPLLLVLGYVVAGSVVRLAFAADVTAGRLHGAVVTSALLAAAIAVGVLAGWSRVTSWLARASVPSALTVALVAAAVAWNLFEFERWAGRRTYLNYQASLAIGRPAPARARSCRASWPTACRSRTGSGRCSSATASATTRTGSSATTCAIY